MRPNILDPDVDWDWLVSALKSSIGGGCHTPTIRPVYTAHNRIQMPRTMTDEEQVYLQVELDLLPCNCLFVPTVSGTGMEMHVYRIYQGG